MNKKQNIKALCIAAALLLSGFCAQAQELEISAYFNGVLPTGQFNNKVTNLNPNPMNRDEFNPMRRDTIGMGAAAGIGFTLRAGLWFDMGFGELMPYVEGSFLWNSLRSDVRKAYDAAGAKYPSYYNIPLYLGFKYRYDINEIFRPFAEVGFGYDFFIITKSAKQDDLWYRFKPSYAIGWQIGAGTYLGRNVSVGLYYLGLGSHKIAYAKTSRGRAQDNTANITSPRSLGELAFRIGFHF